MRSTSHLELKKQLPITDSRHTPLFLEHVKSHYEIYDENLEMTQEKLWMLATSAMDTSMRIKWLETLTSSPALRKALKFSNRNSMILRFLSGFIKQLGELM